jgi:hypothetical protein
MYCCSWVIHLQSMQFRPQWWYGMTLGYSILSSCTGSLGLSDLIVVPRLPPGMHDSIPSFHSSVPNCGPSSKGLRGWSKEVFKPPGPSLDRTKVLADI